MTESSSQMGADLVAALATLQDPVKDGKVNAGQRSYTFLTLSQLLNTARTTLGAHNLAVMQWPERTDDGVQVHTTLIHTSGQRMDFAPLGIRCSPDAQSVGSAVTYSRRYALAAILGLAGADDDDGHHATAQDRQRQEYAQTRPVTREAPDPAEDPYYVDREPPPVTGGGMGPFTEGMVASQKQKAAIHAIMAQLLVAQPKHADFLLWLLRRDSPDRPADLTLTKGDASKVIELLKGDQGKPLADEFLGTMT